jgi:hypothetical protein
MRITLQACRDRGFVAKTGTTTQDCSCGATFDSGGGAESCGRRSPQGWLSEAKRVRVVSREAPVLNERGP